MPIILKAESLTKSFKSGEKSINVLDNIEFEVETGSTLAIVGPSGSGKTTLLGLCAGLDQPTSGRILLNEISLTGLSENQLAQLRNAHVGFVFQNFQLIPTLTALENVMVPLELRGEKNIRPRAEELLQRVGLVARMNHYPSQLSGGEQQRVAIARAFSNKPKVLFADEPTGNLDDETSQNIEALLFELNQEEKTTLILVTHDHELASRTDQVIRLRAGKIQNES